MLFPWFALRRTKKRKPNKKSVLRRARLRRASDEHAACESATRPDCRRAKLARSALAARTPRGPESGAPAAPRARWWRWSTRASSSSSRSPSLPPSFLSPRPPTHHPVVTTRAGAGSSATSSSSTSARPTCRRRHWRCSPNPRPRRMLIDNRIASRVGGCCIGSDPISIAGAARVCVVDRPARCELAPGAGRRRRVCAAQAPGPHGRCRMTCGRWARGEGGAQARPPTWRVCVCVCVQMAQSEMLHVRCARRLLVRFGDREALYSTTISSLGA